jgi:hypothetical protein
MEDNMRVQIIIPAINLWTKFSKDCIESVVKACEGLEYRIMFIDNNSFDETLVEAGKLVSSTFSHYRSPIRMGCAESWNVGVKDAIARGFDKILILNNDIVIHQDAIKQLLKRFKKGDVGMVTCMDVKGQCNNIPTALFELNSRDFKGIPEAPNPNFSAFMISKECYEKVGEFDEGFEKAYHEDNDWHRRMMLCNENAIVLPTALFFHFGSGTQNNADGIGRPIVSGEQFNKNLQYYISKWGGDHEGNKETLSVPFGNKDIKWTKQSDKQ